MKPVAAFLTLVVVGAIVADLVTHPAGTTSGLNGLNSVLKTNLQAASGQKIG